MSEYYNIITLKELLRKRNIANATFDREELISLNNQIACNVGQFISDLECLVEKVKANLDDCIGGEHERL